MSDLTHIDKDGNACMVEVGDKDVSQREAVAEGWIQIGPDAFEALQAGSVKKGDVLSVAQIAGIQAAKKTADLIPLCHPLSLTGVQVHLEAQAPDRVHVRARVRTRGQTGVEMEALCAVNGALLCVYDMLKAVDRAMVIESVCLQQKRGGKSGDFVRTPDLA